MIEQCSERDAPFHPPFFVACNVGAAAEVWVGETDDIVNVQLHRANLVLSLLHEDAEGFFVRVDLMLGQDLRATPEDGVVLLRHGCEEVFEGVGVKDTR